MGIFDQSCNKANSPSYLGCCRESPHPFSTLPHSPSHDKQLLTQEDQQQKEEIDTLLSEAFNNMTFAERQVQQEELHGVADEIVEEASLIESSLQELALHVAKTKAGRVYETAERQSPAYVHARSFQISFLRAERYNTKAAADRMMRFFDEKQKLFGTEKLTKDISIEDLDQDDIVALKAGGIQWAGRDRSNRPILLHIPSIRKFKELKNELRARYFIMMEAAKSTEIQLRGFVVLSYTVGDCKDSKQGHGFPEHSKIAEAIPLFTGAFHFACDDIKQHIFHTAVFGIMPAGLRARFRLHFGTHLECQYRLTTYGILTGLLPLSPETNTIDMAPHLRWCQSYISNNDNGGTKKQLITVSFPSSITEPNPKDVLSAGSQKSDNVGNNSLRVLVKESMEAYRSASYAEKRRIADRIIDEIHSAGGRFLQKEKGSQTWNELPLSKVRVKITQRFRNQYRRRESASQPSREGALISDTALLNDVIFGRVYPRNKGTALLHQLIKDRLDEYVAANRGAKIDVVNTIIERIRSKGGRFLQPSTSGGYVELSTDSVRDRMSTYFRNYRRPSRNTTMASGL